MKFCTNSLTLVKKAEYFFQSGHNVKCQEEMALQKIQPLPLCEYTDAVGIYTALEGPSSSVFWFFLKPSWLKSCLCKSHMKGPNCEFWSRTSV